MDLDHEIKVQTAVRDLITAGLVKSAHDCSEGGVAVALAESCFNPQKPAGANVVLDQWAGSAGDTPATAAEILFHEAQSRIIISVVPQNLEKTMTILRKSDVSFGRLGTVGKDELRIRVGDDNFSWPIADLYDDWWNSIARAVQGDKSIERVPSL